MVLRWDNSFVWFSSETYLGGQISNRYSMWEQNGNWIVDCVSQELLEMFGLPYIIAPMEAEAQCAYLDTVHLVDGVVTDDCDVFLFGGLSVYKNIFDDRKYVETYYMKVLSCLDLGLGVYSLSLIIYPSGDQWNIYSFRSCFNSSPCFQDAVYLLCEQGNIILIGKN